MTTLLFALFVVLSVGQAPAPPPTPPPANPQSPPSPPPNYKYSSDGRRDPFVSLVNRGTTDPRQGQAARVRPEGLPGVLIDEVVVKGILESRGGYVAMLGTPSGKTYSVRAGDRLMDGVVRSITPQAVVLMQEVNDPLSLEKQREVRKYLRGEVK